MKRNQKPPKANSPVAKAKEKVATESTKFAEGVCFQKLFIVFIIGSIFGDYYERILNFVGNLYESGAFYWERRSGLIYGPFSVVYGAGAVLMTWALVDRKLKWWQIILLGALIGGGFEYIISILQEIFTGTTSWDYSGQLGDIGGRTTIPIALIWGLFCLVFVEWIYPPISRLIEKIPKKTGTIVLNITLVILCIDALISFSAMIRYSLRARDIQPFTPYGQFLDTVYPDTRMRRAYPNTEMI